MAVREPGVYLLTGETTPRLGLRPCGAFLVGGAGPFFSEASDPVATVLFEGILLGDRHPGLTDAEVALQRVRTQGPDALEQLDGFYRAVLVEPGEGRARLVGDPMATRPQYVYRGSTRAAVAPGPAFMARAGLPMQLDRAALYQLFRLCHPVGPGSLISPVERSRPRTTYRIFADGRVDARRPPPLRKHEDRAIDLERAATLIHDTHARIVSSVLEHPRLRGRAVHLPLTAGMDSRHLLGALLEAGAPPQLLCHVRLDPEEHAVVQTLARTQDLPLWAPAVEHLDLRGLLRTWARRCAGMVHVHQLYLMGVAQQRPPEGMVGFDGYLADLFLGQHRLPVPLEQRYYVDAPLRWLFPDHRELEASCRRAIERERAGFVGSADFVASACDAFNRGPWYTGGAFGLVDPDAAIFAPGAHGDALELFRTIPESVGRYKRARLRMFHRDFPSLARVPAQNGVPLCAVSTLPDHKASSLGRRLWSRLRASPQTVGPHRWLRRVDVLRQIHARVVHEGWLLRDGILPRAVVRALWHAHQQGARTGFAIMSLLSAEVGYRVCVLGQDPDAVTDWLLAEESS